MRKEDYNIITPDNKVWNFKKWIAYSNIPNNTYKNPYPVMYVDGKAVYEGDKLIFNSDNDGISHQTLREVKWQHRALINDNKDWIKSWSFSVLTNQLRVHN